MGTANGGRRAAHAVEMDTTERVPPGKRRFQVPHALVLLVACIVVGAAASYFVPAGEYDRRDDPQTGRKVVVAGTFHPVPQKPVRPFDAMVAIPKGMADAGSVIFMVFMAGGAFMVVDQTGALRKAVTWLVRKLQNRKNLVIPVICTLFATGGVVENMQEEIIALVPVLLMLTSRLGYNPLTAVAISIGAASVGSAFSPINPFQVTIAQKLAQLPLISGAPFRIVFLLLAIAIWILATMRYAARTKSVSAAANLKDVESDNGNGAGAPSRRSPGSNNIEASFDARSVIVLAIVVVTFTSFVYGVMKLGWDFDQMTASFFLMGVAAGIVGRLGFNGTAEAFVDGFRSMAFAGLLIGFARGIYIVLDQGRIIDTIVNAMVTPLESLPVAASAFGMMIMHTLVHFAVPSVSGQAVLTMPVLVPLSDLLGLSRQVTVLAYQYGAGLCELLTPTNGALMAIIAATRVRFDDWIRFVFPIYAILFALGAVAVFVAIATGLR